MLLYCNEALKTRKRWYLVSYHSINIMFTVSVDLIFEPENTKCLLKSSDQAENWTYLCRFLHVIHPFHLIIFAPFFTKSLQTSLIVRDTCAFLSMMLPPEIIHGDSATDLQICSPSLAMCSSQHVKLRRAAEQALIPLSNPQTCCFWLCPPNEALICKQNIKRRQLNSWYDWTPAALWETTAVQIIMRVAQPSGQTDYAPIRPSNLPAEFLWHFELRLCAALALSTCHSEAKCSLA